MNAKLLGVPPISGEFAEKQFDAVGNSVWVKFTSDEYEEWCGVFGVGQLQHNSAVCVPEHGLAFVLAGGIGYWVNLERRDVVHRTRSEWLVEAIALPGRALVIAATYTNILLISPNGVEWDSGRVSLDGITFSEVTSNEASGLVNDCTDVGAPFTLNIDERSYQCRWKCPLD